MAWPATETFESYANGNNLNTRNGGSGWGGAWADVTLSKYIVANDQAYDGSLSVKVTTASGEEPEISRPVSSSTDGDEVTFAIRKDTNSIHPLGVFGYDATTYRWYLQLSTGGNIVLNGTNVGTYSANTWYKFSVQLDYTNHRARVSIDGGAYSSYVTFNGGVGTSTTKLNLIVSSSGVGTMNGWIDTIKPPGATVTIGVSDTVTLSEVLSAIRVKIIAVADTISLSEVISVLFYGIYTNKYSAQVATYARKYADQVATYVKKYL